MNEKHQIPTPGKLQSYLPECEVWLVHNVWGKTRPMVFVSNCGDMWYGFPFTTKLGAPNTYRLKAPNIESKFAEKDSEVVMRIMEIRETRLIAKIGTLSKADDKRLYREFNKRMDRFIKSCIRKNETQGTVSPSPYKSRLEVNFKAR